MVVLVGVVTGRVDCVEKQAADSMNYGFFGAGVGDHFAIRPRGPAAQPSPLGANVIEL
jgi:hypothetical protein